MDPESAAMACAPHAMPYWTCLRSTPPPSIPVGTMTLTSFGSLSLSTMFSTVFQQYAAITARAQLVQRIYCAISSSERPRVNGPLMPIESITISMLTEIKTNTPVVPNCFKKKAIMKLVKIVDSLLKE